MHARVVHLGWEKVSCSEKCPQFRGVLIEREVPVCVEVNNFYTNTLSLPHTAQWSETVCGWVSLSKPQHSPQLTGSKNRVHYFPQLIIHKDA